ncbi:MAG: MarR family transcriptional regulator [Eubacteriales bacterium]|nr:MarR family transcriptional regulator [Eubacteriales bacterium]
MKNTLDAINSLLSSVFYDIIKLEEKFLKKSKFKDISIKEVRTIESIGLSGIKSMSTIAKKLSITVGTLTVSINNLLKKGYVIKEKSTQDKRVVIIRLTEKGKALFKAHQKFKEKIMKEVILDLTKQEAEIFNGALSRVSIILNSNM